MMAARRRTRSHYYRRNTTQKRTEASSSLRISSFPFCISSIWRSYFSARSEILAAPRFGLFLLFLAAATFILADILDGWGPSLERCSSVCSSPSAVCFWRCFGLFQYHPAGHLWIWGKVLTFVSARHLPARLPQQITVVFISAAADGTSGIKSFPSSVTIRRL